MIAGGFAPLPFDTEGMPSARRMIIAIVGMTGSGKSILADVLRKEGIPVIRFGQFVVDEMARRGLPEGPESERTVREDLRKLHGMDALAKLALPAIGEQLARSPVVGIDGLYSYSEYRTLKNAFGDDLLIIAVYTSRALRHRRLQSREERPLTRRQTATHKRFKRLVDQWIDLSIEHSRLAMRIAVPRASR